MFPVSYLLAHHYLLLLRRNRNLTLLLIHLNPKVCSLAVNKYIMGGAGLWACMYGRGYLQIPVNDSMCMHVLNCTQ